MQVIRPTVVTDSILLSSSLPETDYAAYAVGTTYATGAKVIVVATHKIYESLQNSNTGHYPPDNLTGATPYWLEIGATNRWRMFDSKVNSISSASNSITLSLLSSNVSAISVLEVDAATLNITVTDPTDGEIFNTTYDTISFDNVIDGFTYFFEPFLYSRNIYAIIPPYAAATIAITASYPTSTANIGELVVGALVPLGCTSFGASIGILDYSVKTTDDFGNYTVLERAYSKRGNFDLEIPNSSVGFVMDFLATYRATPLVWIPTQADYLSSPLIIYGFYKEFNIVVEYHNFSKCSLEIQGLT